MCQFDTALYPAGKSVLVLEQVDPICQQILGAGDGLARWAEEQGYARAPFEWITEA